MPGPPRDEPGYPGRRDGSDRGPRLRPRAARPPPAAALPRWSARPRGGPARPGCSMPCPACWGRRMTRRASPRSIRCCATCPAGTAARGCGYRLGAGGPVPAVLEQKVVILEAHRAWRRLLLKFGRRAPGPAPAGLRVFPAAQTWQRIPSWEWHLAGVGAARAPHHRGRRPGGRPGRGDPQHDRGRRRLPATGPAGVGPGPRRTSGSGPAATPTRLRSAITTCRGPWAGRWPGGWWTTPGCWTCWRRRWRPIPGDQAGGAERRAAAAPGPPERAA